MSLLLLLACRAPVIGMAIDAEVTCDADSGEQCDLDRGVSPCDCNPHRFDREAGTVGVASWSWQQEPTVVYDFDYHSEFELCAMDGIVVEETEMRSVEGEPLYTIDGSGALTPIEDSPLVAMGDDTLTFEYPVAGGIAREVHTVVFRETMDGQPYTGIRCCGTPVGASWLLVGAGLATVVRRRRPGWLSPVPPPPGGPRGYTPASQPGPHVVLPRDPRLFGDLRGSGWRRSQADRLGHPRQR